LIGAQIAFYLQNPQFVAARRGTVTLDHAFKEHLALAVMFLVARDYRTEGPVWTFDSLSRRLFVNADPLRTVLDRLLDAGLLVGAGDDGERYAPGRDTEAITLFEILDTTRHGSGLAGHGGIDSTPLPEVDAVQETVHKAIRESLADRTLRDLVMEA
jgi:membrane protein